MVYDKPKATGKTFLLSLRSHPNPLRTSENLNRLKPTHGNDAALPPKPAHLTVRGRRGEFRKLSLEQNEAEFFNWDKIMRLCTRGIR